MRERRAVDILNIFLTAFVFLLAVGFIVVRTQGQERVQQVVAVQNASPKVVSVIQSMEAGGSAAELFFLTTGRTTPLYVWGRVSDANGCADLRNVTMKAYRADLGQGCDPTDGLCMITADIPIEGCAAGFDTASYAAAINFPYFTDPTDTGSDSDAQAWIVRVTVTDTSGAQGQGYSADFDVASIAAMEADDHLDFGLLTLGAMTSGVPLQITNVGNRPFDFEAGSYGSMACNGAGSGSIPVEDLHVSLLGDTTFAEAEPMKPPQPYIPQAFLGDGANGFTNPNGNNQISSTDNAQTYYIAQPIYLPTNVQTKLTSTGISRVYYFLHVPTDGISGVCNGSMGITAVPK